MPTYTFSIKCNLSGIGEELEEFAELYDEIFVPKLGTVEYAIPEWDSKHKLHTHGVVTFENPIKYIDFKKTGWHIYMRRLYDSKGWRNYTTKNFLKKTGYNIQRETRNVSLHSKSET